MTQVEFQYNGNITVIQCQEEQKMSEICDNFINKSKINDKEIYYFYDGQGGTQFNKNLTFNQIANSFDKSRKKMSVLVYDNDTINKNNSKIKSKNIICPKCYEQTKMNIQNYKINLFECKNNHNINNILFNDFEKTQMIDLTKIICDICKERNKAETYNNEFFKCYECDINLCPLCRSQHNKNHCIYNYDKINSICNKHNESIISYCNKCSKNLCFICEKDHNGHEIYKLGNMLIEKNELIEKLNELKKYINIFIENINKIMNVLNNVRENVENYYKLEEYIVNNYDKNERNYEILYNINEMVYFNNIIIKDINNINNENNIENKFINILNINNQINNSEIKITLDIKKEDINKEIYFLDNTDGKVYINTNDKEEHHHDFLKELNESNVELYINNQKYKYQKYFKPEKEGIYELILKFNINMKDCNFMFYNCKNIINIDFSSFNSKNITNMLSMFEGCTNLTNIDLSSFNTKNVTNMNCLFLGCKNLLNVDLSSFNTDNINSLYCLFENCSNLTNIDLSSFNTKNVTNMAGMFAGCSKLEKINLSSFNVNKVTDMRLMFAKCFNLINIDLCSFDINNNTNVNHMFKDCSNLKEIKINNHSSEIIKKLINQKITKITLI